MARTPHLRGMRLAGLAIVAIAIGMAGVAPAIAKKKQAPDNSALGKRFTVEQRRGMISGICTIEAEGLDSANVRRAVEAALDDIAETERVLIGWGSDVSRLNQGPVQTRLPVSQRLSAALAAALDIARETNGAYDPTLEPLVRAWDLRGAGRVPDAAELNDARTRVGWMRVQLDPSDSTVWFQRDGMALDLSGIEVGYALERAERILRDRQMKRAAVGLSGNVLAISDAQPFIARVAHPTEPSRTVMTVVAKNGAVATTSAFGRTLTVKGVAYGHVLDPRRGVPIDTPASVTVVTRSPTRADALSNALLVMGREDAERFAAEHPDIGVLWLEMVAGELHGWRWNLTAVAPTAGTALRWMD